MSQGRDTASVLMIEVWRNRDRKVRPRERARQCQTLLDQGEVLAEALEKQWDSVTQFTGHLVRNHTSPEHVPENHEHDEENYRIVPRDRN